jgi:hypothetical protein
MESFISTLSVIYPVLCSIILIIILFSVKVDANSKTNVTINIWFIDFTIPFIKSLYLVRFILIITIIGFAIFPLFRDYTPFFPKNYKLTVSYRNNDIQAALGELTKEEKKKFNIIEDIWVLKKDMIWKNIVNNIVNKMNEKINPKYVQMIAVAGYTYFSVKKVGFLKYDLDESYGNLDQELQLSDNKTIRVFTRFQLKRKERFNITLGDIYFRRGIIVAGKFKQYLYSQNELIYLFDVLAITKVSFLPSISVGETIYLYEDNNNKMIPLGVAVNSAIERD